jgi:hypothetical protein
MPAEGLFPVGVSEKCANAGRRLWRLQAGPEDRGP